MITAVKKPTTAHSSAFAGVSIGHDGAVVARAWPLIGDACGASYRGTGPKKAEFVALPLAVADLRNFTNYMQVIGATAPPYADIVQMFDVTDEWSSMRTASSAWDAYCVDQEGICWRAMRAAMDRLKPAFDLAATGDPTLTSKFAGLATLLGVKKAIAKKAVTPSPRRA